MSFFQDYLKEIGGVTIILSTLIIIFGYLFSLGPRGILNSFETHILPQNDKYNGILVLVLSISPIILIFIAISSTVSDAVFFFVIGAVFFISLIISNYYIKKIVYSKEEYNTKKIKSKLFIGLTITYLMVVGTFMFFIVLDGTPSTIKFFKDQFSVEEQFSKYVSISIICLKILIYYFYIALTSGKFYSLYYLLDAKKYIAAGEGIVDINKIVYKNDSNTLEGYLVAENKKSYLFKPDGYCCIPINRDIVKMIPIPADVKKTPNK
ncbi:hypothetical protein [Ruminiclostridium cellobioparum]|uniref:Uncharacterized protein n=1 Tax=Ruminiclostridium cellobioparum subsp. termitidis CT1112 TaxID=1195236 RepID=S0FUU1_RUMCE|nr:hypothetical protein [Ruminiclostridium cellobioparum]EMS72298.1 hypothetical protein CTER_1753 [Ruminiclostridium cellobioparum subsp. termitidis CT1112]